MFVEEVERGKRQPLHRFSPFLVSSPAEIERMMRSNLMTVVIDVGKGMDVRLDTLSPDPCGRTQFDNQLLATFSAQGIKQAKRCIEDTKPQIRQILSEARINGAFATDAASAAVERIMSAALNDAGALIATAKLKEKDEVTFLHSLAVSALMVTFGRNLGHSEEDVRLLGIGGLVHDLGKMTLPNAILTKTGKLNDEEMELVRAHPQRGYDLISRIENASKPVLDICRHHHEKFDGTGYPLCLAGKQIPYVARLAAVCDVYEALTTVRPYKRAWSQAEAINMMMNSPGHFDDTLLKAFISRMVVNGTLH